MDVLECLVDFFYLVFKNTQINAYFVMVVLIKKVLTCTFSSHGQDMHLFNFTLVIYSPGSAKPCKYRRMSALSPTGQRGLQVKQCLLSLETDQTYNSVRNHVLEISH